MTASWRLALVIVRNDLRLTYRSWREQRWGAWLSVGVLAALLLLLSGVSIFLFSGLDEEPGLFLQGLIWGVIGFMMFGSAVNQTVTVLCERADFDLLLSAPVPARTLLLARLASITAAAALGTLLLFVPLALGLTVGLHLRHLASLPTWAALAVIVAMLSITFGLGLVRALGIKRARIAIQVFGAFIGAFAYLATQARHFDLDANPWLERGLNAALQVASLEGVARAARGEWGPLSLVLAMAVAAVGLGRWALERTFLRGAQDGGEASRSTRSEERLRFRTGLTVATVRKDVRLIRRDPLLLSQLLPPLLYMIPGVFALTRHPGLNSLAPLTLVVVMQTTGVLALVAAHGEECWDLIRMSPTAELQLRRGKALAALVGPGLLGVLLCGVMVALGRPWLALLTLGVTSLNGAAVAWLSVARIRPRSRQELLQAPGRKRKGNVLATLLSILLGLTGAFGLSLSSHPAVVARVIGLALLGVNLLAAVCCLVLVEPTAADFEEPLPAPAA